MADALPIPRAIWEKITAWLKAGGTGRITLDAHQGKVRKGSISMALDDEAPLPPPFPQNREIREGDLKPKL